MDLRRFRVIYLLAVVLLDVTTELVMLFRLMERLELEGKGRFFHWTSNDMILNECAVSFNGHDT